MRTPTELLALKNGAKILIKRDDLYPIPGGGNKGRKVEKIFKNDIADSCSAIITNGGIDSNHARACALMAAKNGIKAHLVLHGRKKDLNRLAGNSLIYKMCDADLHVVGSNMIEDTINQLKQDLKSDCADVHVIPGGGHCISGAIAYANAIEEIDQLPDFIVLPSGTGGTQAGIMAGLDLKGAHTRVIGISVARQKEAGKKAIESLYLETRRALGLEESERRQVEFYDDWVASGYGKTNRDQLSLIAHASQAHGLILDPTYTGKAFFGLTELLDRGAIPAQNSVLFWHTGGLMNAIASAELKAEILK